MANGQSQNALSALEWHIEHGADEALSDSPVDRTKMPDLPVREQPEQPKPAARSNAADLIGAAEAKIEAEKLAEGCKTLEALRELPR